MKMLRWNVSVRCFLALLTSALFLLTLNPALGRAEPLVVVAPAPAGEPLSTQFKVSAAQSDVPVYRTIIASSDSARRMKALGNITNAESFADHASFASFDMAGPAEINVTSSEPVQSVKLLPSSLGILPTIAGNRITFTIVQPSQVTVEINGHWTNCLHLFANPMEGDPLPPDDPREIYFGPGVHEITGLTVTSGQTLYVADGAVVRGRYQPGVGGDAVIRLIGNNIVVRGHGIIDGGLCPRHTKNLLVAQGTNIFVEGVTLRDSSTWTFPIQNAAHVTVKNIKIFGYRGNSDGIDICNSHDVNVSDCFLRTMDDLVVIKTPRSDQDESRNITVQHCVLWNELAHALSIGAELRQDVEDVHFSDCDVIHDHGREWLLRVYHCDSARIHDIAFDNIRIEESKRLISLWIGRAVWSKDPERGHIDHITFRNITAAGPKPSLDLQGFDINHVISNVQFDHVLINGKPLAVSAVKQNQFVQDVTVTP